VVLHRELVVGLLDLPATRLVRDPEELVVVALRLHVPPKDLPQHIARGLPHRLEIPQGVLVVMQLDIEVRSSLERLVVARVE